MLRYKKNIPILFFSLLLVLFYGCAFSRNKNSPGFSFAVVSDPRGAGDTWRNALKEIRDMNINPKPFFSPSEFVIVTGDMDPLEERYNDFKEIFNPLNKNEEPASPPEANLSPAGKKLTQLRGMREQISPNVFNEAIFKPQFLPVIGNHEFEDGEKHFKYARDVIIPSIPNVVRRHSKSCDYYFDYRNVRIIAIDGYTELGKDGVINNTGKEWAEQTIISAPAAIKHIFVSFHEPAFPRYRHLNDSFNESLKERDAFWEMLVNHRDRVRAVFVGHTHNYYRMRVFYPSAARANSFIHFPDEEAGIYQIDAGASGQADINTVIEVQIEDNKIFFRALQAEKGSDKLFQIKDEWKLQ